MIKYLLNLKPCFRHKYFHYMNYFNLFINNFHHPVPSITNLM